MRTSQVAFAALLGLLYVTSVDTGPARAADCKELLNNNLYLCSTVTESGETPTNCFQANTSEPAPGKFTLSIPGTSYTLQCSCLAEGSIHSPEFNTSKEFLCGNNATGDALIGKVTSNGRQIRDAQGFCQIPGDCPPAGAMTVVQCVLDPECSL